jgi:hypothetical protein
MYCCVVKNYTRRLYHLAFKIKKSRDLWTGDPINTQSFRSKLSTLLGANVGGYSALWVEGNPGC